MMQLPHAVHTVLEKLHSAGFEAFAVGGCVRDILLGRTPADWDVATNATPEEIQKVFPKSFYANTFGTVTVLIPPNPPLTRGALSSAAREKHSDTTAAGINASPDKGRVGGVSEVEVTTYRVDAEYSDQRHPDAVQFTTHLKEDLARRDFTVNAMALNPTTPSPRQDGVVIDGMYIIDPFGGLKDLDAKIIRAVGDPEERFSEDALRLLRAVRLAAQLDFTIAEQTLRALTAQAPAINAVSHERVRDEIIKLVMSEQPEYGFTLLQQTGLLHIILPELAEGIGVTQNKHHIYTVFEHNSKSLQWAARYEYPLHVRLAALLHDVGKPKTRRRKGDDYTFYGHDIVGARMTEKLLRRLKFSNDLVQHVTHLVRHHMFYYDVGKVTEAGARRLLRRIGKENFDDAIKVRIAERKGSGVPKAEPYRLRHLQFLVEKAAQEPTTTSELAVTGTDIMAALNLRPGPQIGGILNALLAEVLDDPAKNEREGLLKRAAELKDANVQQLKALGEAAKDAEDKRREDDIRRKYHV